jgi:hypothetical protein
MRIALKESRAAILISENNLPMAVATSTVAGSTQQKPEKTRRSKEDNLWQQLM